jgi:hypothetical protein
MTFTANGYDFIGPDGDLMRWAHWAQKRPIRLEIAAEFHRDHFSGWTEYTARVFLREPKCKDTNHICSVRIGEIMHRNPDCECQALAERKLR